jgi:hypothetical protein
MTIGQMALLRESVRAVPAVRYALGVAGLLAVVAIAGAIGLTPTVAVFGTLIVLVLMIVLLLFARLTTTAPRHFLRPVLVLMWGSLALLLATAALLFTSVFFHQPLDFRAAPAVATAPLQPAAPGADPLVAKVVQSQLGSRDYAGAWATISGAVQKQPSAVELLDLQAEVAEHWVRDAKPVVGQTTFTAIVEPLLPVLYQAAARNEGQAAADALAHIGWAHFLQSREGAGGQDIEGKYREALQQDPMNPFAHSMWGHWILVNHGPLAEAQAHFAAAVQSGREREFVRQFELAALQWSSDDKSSLLVITVLDEMRRGGESFPAEERARLLRKIYSVYNRELLANIERVLLPADHIATLDWLAQGLTLDSTQVFYRARLLEAQGNCEAALSTYQAMPSHGTLGEQVQQGMARCRAGK